jgi:hypothetical protein
VNDGIRTHDRLDHNQELYQLSYVHQEYGSGTRPGSIANLHHRAPRPRAALPGSRNLAAMDGRR